MVHLLSSVPENVYDDAREMIQSSVGDCLRSEDCGSPRQAVDAIRVFEDEELALGALLAFSDRSDDAGVKKAVAEKIVRPQFVAEGRRARSRDWLVPELTARLPFPTDRPRCDLLGFIVEEARQKREDHSKPYGLPEPLLQAHQSCADADEEKDSADSEGAKEDTGKAPPEKPPIVLEPVHRVERYASSRFSLSNGDIVQMQTGCSEWKGGGRAFLVQLSRSKKNPPIVEFYAGRNVRELEKRGHMLLVERKQVGNDASDDPLDLPRGAEADYRTTTGTVYVSRVSVIDLETGQHRDAGWDTFSPVTTGSQRYVVLASDDESAFMVTERKAASYWVWDVESGKKQKLADSSGPPAIRVTDAAILVRISEGDSERYVKVDAESGKTSTPTSAQWENAREPSSETLERLESDYRGDWRHESGRRILVPAESNDAERQQPLVSRCGLGPYWTDEFLFTDQGLYHWPGGVELEKK